MFVRRLRGNGRNKREGDYSDEPEEDDSDSNSSEDIGDHTSDSVGGRSSSEDDPSENRRPGRDARTRAKVTPLLSLVLFILTGEPGKNKATRAEEDREKGLKHVPAF